jgi:hypothetical protein
LSSSPFARDHEPVPLSEAKKAKILSESQPATKTTTSTPKSSNSKNKGKSSRDQKKKNKIGGKHVLPKKKKVVSNSGAPSGVNAWSFPPFNPPSMNDTTCPEYQ